jgi:hypothetical protein
MDNNWIYPSAFNHCVLSFESADTSLFFQNSGDTLYVQLAGGDKIHGCAFHCDYVLAKDGGLPFLTVIKKIGDDIDPRDIFTDPEFFDINSPHNEYRVRFPTMFPIDDIIDVFDFIIPNFYGNVCGVAFSKDKHAPVVDAAGKDVFTMKKTNQSDIYELFDKNGRPVDGNNVAYIPTLELSRAMSKLMLTRDSMRVKCDFHDVRRKWIPCLSQSEMSIR